MSVLGNCSSKLLWVLLYCNAQSSSRRMACFMELLTPINTFVSCCQGPQPSRIPAKLLRGCCHQQGTGTQRPASFSSLITECFALPSPERAPPEAHRARAFPFFFIFSIPCSCFSYCIALGHSLCSEGMAREQAPCCISSRQRICSFVTKWPEE